jgi:hypothetical protein
MLPDNDFHGFKAHRHHGDRRDGKDEPPTKSIITGAALLLVFGTLFMTRPQEWWWIFPAVFAGAIPLLEGLRRAVFGKRGSKDSRLQKEADSEKQILRAAHEAGGRLTASAAALKTSLTIKEAQGILERMAKEGHAVMNVTREGLVEFEFPEFLPRLP